MLHRDVIYCYWDVLYQRLCPIMIQGASGETELYFVPVSFPFQILICAATLRHCSFSEPLTAEASGSFRPIGWLNAGIPVTCRRNPWPVLTFHSTESAVVERFLRCFFIHRLHYRILIQLTLSDINRRHAVDAWIDSSMTKRFLKMNRVP